MAVFRGASWEINLPVGWIGEHEDDCEAVFHEDGVGALQLSGAAKNEEVTDQDLREFASEHLEAGATPQDVEFGPYRGFTFAYGKDRRYWCEWYLRSLRNVLYVTYNCSEEDRGIEDDDVQAMLKSLRRISDCG